MSDDEQCGAETISGEPCQNPAGENGRCWIPSHTDPDAENPGGRDFTLGEDDHEDILKAARMGKSENGCARAAGVAWHTLDRYLDAHPDFRRAFARARGVGESTCIQNARHEGGDPSFEKFMLASSFDYVQTEKQEVDMDADHTFDASEGVSAEFVSYEDTEDADGDG